MLENVVLPLDPRDGLVHVGKDGPLEKILRPAFLDDTSENVSVKGLRYRFAFLFRIRYALQRFKELPARVHDVDRNAEALKKTHNLIGFSLAHEAVFDKNRFEALIQGPMPQHRDHGRIDAARQGVDRDAVPNSVRDLVHLFVDELLGIELPRGNFLNHG